MTGYRIVRWGELYEPSRHEVRHGRELRYVKAYVHGADQSSSCRNLIYLAQTLPDVGVSARDAFALFVKLLEMAGNTPRSHRDGTIYARAGQDGDRQPASLENVARALWPLFDGVDQVRACMTLLCHADVGWVEPFEWELASFPEELASRIRQFSEKWRHDDAAHEAKRRTPDAKTAESGVRVTPQTAARGVLTEPVTEPNRTGNPTEENRTGTGAILTRGDRTGSGRLASVLAAFSGGPDAWAVKAGELLAHVCGLDAAARQAQGKAITAVMLRIAESPERAELAAKLIGLAEGKLKCRVLRNPWGAWQRAADVELNKRGMPFAGGDRRAAETFAGNNMAAVAAAM